MASTKEEFVSGLNNLKDKPLPNQVVALERHYTEKLGKCQQLWGFRHLMIVIVGYELFGVSGTEEHRKTLNSLISFGKEKNQSFQTAINSLIYDLLQDPDLVHNDEYLSVMRTIDTAMTDHLLIGIERGNDLIEKLGQVVKSKH